MPSVDVQVQPRGAVVGYLQSDRYDVLTPGQPIDADLNGVIDHPLNVESGRVGDGQTVTYTVAVRNSGEGAMPDAVITATARGALQLTSSSTVALGNIPPPWAAGSTMRTWPIHRWRSGPDGHAERGGAGLGQPAH